MNILCRLVVSITLLVLLTPALTAVAEEKENSKTGTHGTFVDEKLKVGTQERLYRLMVPKLLDLKKPASLVFAFHGMGIDSSKVMPLYTKLDNLSAEKKFILVYPEAVGRSWGIDPKKVTADLAFFDALVAEISAKYEVDANRIYVLGMSNGGYFAHLVGKERSTKVAAVCSHSGPLGLQTILGINAERKFPVMIVHGDKDRLFDVKIARENRDKYEREKHEVKYVEVPGLNHFWATDVKINDQIWDFFEKHPLKK